MNWPAYQRQWREAQVAILNLPTDTDQESATVDEIIEKMSELYNRRADRSDDAPCFEARN